jgi:Cu2+-exporting ATPase
MGQGAALAQRHADVVLVSGQLPSLTFFLNTARADMRIIRQNFCWAMVYNALALPLAMSGVLGPWQAAFGMALSSVVVVINASRTFRFQSQAHVLGRGI